ncbi:hypothetical protein DFS34DRAFT_305600 [Phlyctochytrium arcticum]|nr:hypothetical protein DFS34DRAFT_305600 [Phlyctochytrium arcticum]
MTDAFETNSEIVLLEESTTTVTADAPKAAKMSKKAKAAAAAAEVDASKSSVVYLGRVPHGFYETEMKAYFAQFGEVKRLRLSRNRKTGKSKHYAFIEFETPAVAAIVAETMHNYLLFNHSLICKVLDLTQVHADLWKGANKRFKRLPRALIQRHVHNKEKDKESHEKHTQSLKKSESVKRKKLAKAGIEYDFPGFSSSS